MPTASHHYPPILEDVLTYLDVSDHPDRKGGRVLVFRDENGAQVTLRLSRIATDILLRKLEAGPIPEPA